MTLSSEQIEEARSHALKEVSRAVMNKDRAIRVLDQAITNGESISFKTDCERIADQTVETYKKAILVNIALEEAYP